MMMNVSGEQGIDAALNFTTSGASTSFRFSKWIFKLGWKGAKLGWSKHKAVKDKQLEMMSDACSAYRGGYVHKGNSEELASLVRELGGNDATKLVGNELFLGDRTDLSLFWKKTEKNKPVTISRAKLEGIESADLRGRVISTFTKAQLDGLVAYDGNTYALTSKGREAILNPDFVLARIRGECKLFADANTQLQMDAAQVVNDKIDARLSELGMDGRFDGCDRITLNKERLFRGYVGDSTLFHVPGTARRMSVEIPNSNLIELDSNTYAAFLGKGASYKNVRDGKRGVIGESELFRYFDNKNKLDPKELATMVDKAEVAAKAEMLPTMSKSFDADDFFEAALKHAYRGTGLFATEKIEPDFAPKEGDVYSVFLGGEGSQDFEITRAWQDEFGGREYNLRAVDGGRGDILLPEEAFGEIAFADKADGEAYVKANPERMAEYGEFLTDEVAEATPEAASEVSTYTIPRGEWALWGGEYNVKTKGRDYVSASIPFSDAAPNPDGSLTVDVYSNKSYGVRTGKSAAYDATQSGKALGKVFGKPTQAAAQAAKATAQGLKTAASGIEVAAKATDAVATTTTKTVETAAAEISTHKIPRGDWMMWAGHYRIIPNVRGCLSARIPDADATPNPDGSLTIDVYSNKSYDVSTGKRAPYYDIKQNGKDLSKVLGKPIQRTTQTVSKTAAKATEAAANGIESAAKATDAVATTTTKTVETAAAVIPPVEAITATVKVVLDASAKTAKVAAKTATTAAKAGAKGIKAGAKGVEAASKAHGASQKM